MFKIFSTDICRINIKWGIQRVILRPSYIWDARFLKVKPNYSSLNPQSRLLTIHFNNILPSSPVSTECVCLYTNTHTYISVRVGKILSVKQLSAGWSVRESNPGGFEVFRNRPEQPWAQLASNTMDTVLSLVRGADHPPNLTPRLKNNWTYTCSSPSMPFNVALNLFLYIYVYLF